MNKESIFDQQLRIFLCHASSDKARVRELCHRLHDDGYSPWLDEADLLPGQDWAHEITNAVRSSDVVVICLSKESLTHEGYVHTEINVALDAAEKKPKGTIFVIPARLEQGVEVPQQLERWQRVDLFEDHGYEKLVRALDARAGERGIAIRKQDKGAAKRKEKHRLIRFLHSHLLTPPQWHSRINSTLTGVAIALERQLKPARGHVRGRTEASAELNLKRKKGQLLMELLDDAIDTTGLLQEVAASASELFFVTTTARSDLGRYTASFEEPGFAHDIIRMRDLLQRIRADAQVSQLELQEIVGLRRVILEDLWDKFSPLRKEIARYVVPLPVAIQNAVQWANEMLEKIGFSDVWKFNSGSLDDDRAEGDGASATDDRQWNVLVDPQLLQEVLRNIFYNAGYNFRAHRLPAGSSWGDLVTLRVETERRPVPNLGSLDYVVIRAKSLQDTPSTAALQKAIENSTFAQHRLQIEEFGGSLSLRPAENETGAAVELALLSRATVRISEPPRERESK